MQGDARDVFRIKGAPDSGRLFSRKTSDDSENDKSQSAIAKLDEVHMPKKRKGMDETKGLSTPRVSGWVIGTVASLVVVAGFIVAFRDLYHPIDELLIVGVPIAVIVGAMVGFALESRKLSVQTRKTVGIAILIGFALYVVAIVIFLGSRT